jgi:hypothetical protein
MRMAFLVAGVLACSFAASAQEAGPSGALSGLRLGMSVEEAQAATPNWHPIANELGVVQVSVRNATMAGASYNLRLNFEAGRLLNIRAARYGANDGEQSCWTQFDALLAATESGFGPLSEVPRELSAQQQLRELPSGSRVTTERDPNGRYTWVYAWRKAPRINVSASVYPSGERMACYLAASAFAESLWEELAPAAPAPDDIASAPFSEAVLRPAGNDVSRFYPGRAMSLDLEGRVELHCLVIEAAPPRCAVVRETPLGLGFGEAALRIAARAGVAREHAGEPTAGRRIRSYISFQLAD